MLTELETIPAGLIEADATELYRVLPGPTLLHLPGRRERPLYLSVLLHGNETTGLLAVQRLLAESAGRELPRALSLFIGNVEAARHGLRRLDGQPDYNRIWRGGPAAEHRLAQQVLDAMRARRPFAAIDIHNNTGLNPHYACVNRLDWDFLRLARLFARTIVYFLRPNAVSSMAFADLCPAVTVECGQPGQAHGIEHVHEFIDAALNLAELPCEALPDTDLDLFHTVATVTIPESVHFGFEGHGDQRTVDLHLIPQLDHLNFRELPIGTPLARVARPEFGFLQAWDEQGREQTDRYFALRDGELTTTRTLMPSMFTLDERVIRQDCLGYLMERYPVPAAPDRAINTTINTSGEPG